MSADSYLVSVVLPWDKELQPLFSLIQDLRLLSLPRLEFLLVAENPNPQLDLEKEATGWADKVVYPAQAHSRSAALQAGFQAASGDFVLAPPGDEALQWQEFPALIEALLQNSEADAAYGCRKEFAVPQTPQEDNSTKAKWQKLAGHILSRPKLADPATPYRVYRRLAVQSLGLRATAEQLPAEITKKLSRRDFLIHEIQLSC